MQPAEDPNSHQTGPEPAPAPAARAAPPPPPETADNHPVEHPSPTPGIIVLQWLTYAFWGWTVLAMSILTATVLANFISGSETGDFTPYGIAAILVLLPISVACDVFYSKHETHKKTGAASIIMVIHAVIFALFGIGSLIAAVIAIVSMITSSGDSSGAQTTLFSALIIFVLYAATFLRTINPARFPQIRRFYTIFMVISVGLIAILGVAGPLAHAQKTKDDRLIEGNLSAVQYAVEDYARANNRLPDDLSSLSLDGDTKELVSRNLVEYTPNTKAPTSNTQASTYSYSVTSQAPRTIYYYQLCTTYKEPTKDKYYRPGYASSSVYSTGLSSYSHPSGHVCYKLKTRDY